VLFVAPQVESLESAMPTPAMPVLRTSRPVFRVVSHEARHGTDLFSGCSGPSQHHSDASDGRDGPVWTARGSRGDCRFDLDAHGSVGFSSDLQSITTLTPGGSISITAVVRGTTSSFVAHADVNGAVSSRCVVAGVPVDPAETRAWLASFLLALDRETGFAVDTRFPALIATGAAKAVIAEASKFRADHAKAVYFARLVRSSAPGGSKGLVTLDAKDTGAILSAVAALRTDGAKTQLLVMLARRHFIDNPLRTAYANAAATIQNPLERARAIAAADR
jgi:hypothetical protein